MERAYRASVFSSGYGVQMTVMALSLGTSVLACATLRSPVDASSPPANAYEPLWISLLAYGFLLPLRWAAAQLADQERAQRYTSAGVMVVT